MAENINIEESVNKNAIVYEKNFGGMRVLSVYPVGRHKDSKDNLTRFFTKLSKTLVKDGQHE